MKLKTPIFKSWEHRLLGAPTVRQSSAEAARSAREATTFFSCRPGLLRMATAGERGRRSQDQLGGPRSQGERHSILFGKEKIHFSLKRRARKTLGINVHPDMSIEVIAPEDATIEKIHKKVKKRAPWILKQQEYFYQFMPATPPRKYISGETHKYLGRQYRLKIHKSGREEVKLKGQFLHIYTQDRNNKLKIHRLLDKWYREKAKERFNSQIHKMLPQFSRYEISVPDIELKKMPKRWGSCHINGKITLNPDLIKAPSTCIEYVLMHELCHLVEPSHSRKYYQLLKRMMPDWEKRKEKLERSNG